MEKCSGCCSSDLQEFDFDEKLRMVLSEIFDDAFMSNNTNFDNFFDFQSSSAVIVNWNSDKLIYSRALLDSFVTESTRFNSWDDMVKTATDQKYSL